MAKSYIGYTPGTHKANVTVPTLTATSATAKEVVWMAPAPCVIESIDVQLNTTAITGDNTNTINMNALNGGTAGTGTTEIGNKDFPTGTNLAQYGSASLTLSTTLATVTFAEGEKLVLQAEKVGSGGSFGGTAIIGFRYV